ncbi:DUF2391 family protein [Haladaptatus halobius]|uniref:DUF2391 family protein n=1 Tax=Haladaptatus halobius TaxID=2884875 RepID=UPI001D0B7DF6|nr:DUF2391 family protein [Haladaptatus halobius]
MSRQNRRFQFADVAQQFVGGFLFAGPFVVTDEVWWLASNMSWLHALVAVGIVFAIGYGALYEADDDRDPDHEASIIGLPLRFISLIIIAFSSVLLLAFTFNSPATFIPGHNEVVTTSVYVAVTFKAISVSAVFSVVGAATADSVF